MQKSQEQAKVKVIKVNSSKYTDSRSHMAKLVSRARLIAFLPGLKSLRLVVPARNLSSSLQNNRIGGFLEEDAETVWPDSKLGLLSAKDPRFPLPGNVGLVVETLNPSAAFVPVSLPAAPDVLTKPLPQDRHIAILAQFLNSASEIEEDIEIEEVYKKLESHSEVLEFLVQECPVTLRKDVKDLFPDSAFRDKDNVTVFTLCQKTKQDMTGWSPSVEEEREELLEFFMSKAETICEILHSQGFWADFIDPSSGQAFLGKSNPNTALFETDERFKQLGFDIEDLGCCKCIRHMVWGTHVFVGTIFTTAPADSPIIKSILCNNHPLDDGESEKGSEI